ncbi:hypothetical protein [Rhodobacter sp. 24-YEA-8]|uniref:hypothetical protein n=1 Tax=Rhodobacter sp. 24-YEA-8 TaxID=1884310 RepID=UPI0008961081|nr:hypothetical protein [Rhodobacter sp. 24-YEA-8]SEB53084.1 hypothetical protein SAMN05519105_0655 [Rhodobacter sp. 24-YEA-8]
MIRAGIIFAAFAATLAVSPARACEPAEMKPKAGVLRGDLCETSWIVSPSDQARVSSARALAPGLVLQGLRRGNACMGATSYVIHDCARGESLVMAARGYDLYAPERAASDNRLEEKLYRAAGRKAVDLPALRKVAMRHGVSDFQTVAKGASFAFGGRNISFECGCKTLFPEMEGKG